MGRPQLHWFWREAIATVAGAITGMGYMFALQKLLAGVPMPAGAQIIFTIIALMLASAAAVGVYSYTTRRWGPLPLDGETRCRKCGYILRGIPEPRCSECGERI